MVKLVTDGLIDGGLDAIALCTGITVCALQPTNYADIDAKGLIPRHTLAGGDFTIADGDADGRKVTIAQQATLSIDVSGDADHVVIDDGVSEYYVTTCTSQTLTSGGTVTVPAWDIEIRDPT